MTTRCQRRGERYWGKPAAINAGFALKRAGAPGFALWRCRKCRDETGQRAWHVSRSPRPPVAPA